MIYFDNAATSMKKPACVMEAVSRAMLSVGNAGRGTHEASVGAMGLVFETRKRVADFFGAEDPSRIAFTMNSTMALNIAIKGVLSPGDHAITSVLEHNSVLRPLYDMQEKGVSLSFIDADAKGRARLDMLDSLFQRNTRAVVITQASNLTGNLVDVRTVADRAHAHGAILIVDASQSAGFLDIDVGALGIDILCFTGHKAMLGPQGTGGLYVREGVSVRSLLSGGSGIESYNKRHPAHMPQALEAGTMNAHGLAGLNAAVRYLTETGLSAIREKEETLCRAFYEGVRSVDGVQVYGDFDAEHRCPIVALNVRDYSSAELADILFTEMDMCTRAGAHCAPLMHKALGTSERGAVRFSFSAENTMDEINLALRAIHEIAKG